jgi:HlyD family secretion protein
MWVTAKAEGRVEAVFRRIGDAVAKGTPLVQLANSAIQAAYDEAQLRVAVAEAQVRRTRAEGETSVLRQEGQAARLEAEYRALRAEAEAARTLSGDGLVSKLQVQQAELRAQSSEKQLSVEQRGIETIRRVSQDQLSMAESELRLQQVLSLQKREMVESLRISSGADGVLESLETDPGSTVQAGARVARVVDPNRLGATLRVPEALAGEVRVGMPVMVDTRRGRAGGVVSGVHPSAVNGAVEVDVLFSSGIPDGLTAGAAVDSTIEVGKKASVVLIGRPSYVRENSAGTLYCLTSDRRAEARAVRFGVGSTDQIEVIDGVQPGDRCILTEMSRWSDSPTVRIK